MKVITVVLLKLTGPQGDFSFLCISKQQRKAVYSIKVMLLLIFTCPSRSKARQAMPCVCTSLRMDTVCTVYESHTQMYGSLPTCPVATNTRSGCKAKLHRIRGGRGTTYDSLSHASCVFACSSGRRKKPLETTGASK